MVLRPSGRTPGDTIIVMRNIYLVGFMGAGKTLVGAALAARLGCQFIDLDERLGERFGVSISEVFAVHGEGIFRAAETDELARCADKQDVVVATGGGAFCVGHNREIISESKGVSVYLDLPWEELDRRLAVDNGGRPMYANTEQVRSLFEERRPEYRRADVSIVLEGSETPDEVADRVLGEVAPCAI